MINWPSEHVVSGNTLQALADRVYEDLGVSVHPESYFNHRTILAAPNDIVGNFNAQLLEWMPSHSVEMLSTDTVVDPADASDCPIEVLNQLSEPGIPPHKLPLKEGCTVILLRNLVPQKGLCNGTRLQVKSISNHVVVCTYLNRIHGRARSIDGVVLLPRNLLQIYRGFLRRIRPQAVPSLLCDDNQ